MPQTVPAESDPFLSAFFSGGFRINVENILAFPQKTADDAGTYLRRRDKFEFPAVQLQTVFPAAKPYFFNFHNEFSSVE